MAAKKPYTPPVIPADKYDSRRKKGDVLNYTPERAQQDRDNTENYYWGKAEAAHKKFMSTSPFDVKKFDAASAAQNDAYDAVMPGIAWQNSWIKRGEQARLDALKALAAKKKKK